MHYTQQNTVLLAIHDWLLILSSDGEFTVISLVVRMFTVFLTLQTVTRQTMLVWPSPNSLKVQEVKCARRCLWNRGSNSILKWLHLCYFSQLHELSFPELAHICAFVYSFKHLTTWKNLPTLICVGSKPFWNTFWLWIVAWFRVRTKF